MTLATARDTDQTGSYGARVMSEDDATRGAELFVDVDQALRAYHRALDARDAWVRDQAHTHGVRDREIADTINRQVGQLLHRPVDTSNVRAMRNRDPNLVRAPR